MSNNDIMPELRQDLTTLTDHQLKLVKKSWVKENLTNRKKYEKSNETLRRIHLEIERRHKIIQEKTS